jgi:hypothetical protein
MKYEKNTLYDKNGEFLVSTWIEPIMKEHAKLITMNGGHILEFGFGLGVFSRQAQNFEIESHTIVENDPEIYQSLLRFAEFYPNVKPVFSDWWSFESEIKYDGIFYDTESRGFELPNYIHKWSKTGTIISWFSPGRKEISYLKDFTDEFIELPIEIPEFTIYDVVERDTYYMPFKIFIE